MRRTTGDLSPKGASAMAFRRSLSALTCDLRCKIHLLYLFLYEADCLSIVIGSLCADFEAMKVGLGIVLLFGECADVRRGCLIAKSRTEPLRALLRAKFSVETFSECVTQSLRSFPVEKFSGGLTPKISGGVCGPNRHREKSGVVSVHSSEAITWVCAGARTCGASRRFELSF